MTVHARLTYRLTSFLLENLAAGDSVEWMAAFRAQRHAAIVFTISEWELYWLGTRVDLRTLEKDVILASTVVHHYLNEQGVKNEVIFYLQ
ncbi:MULTISPECIES: hypothetical protein [Actinomycetes]|uniref:hypothetical protein n=1 Tax=Actinomycetes TaxID=1760 RepID=UPI000838ADA1|nr:MULTISPECIES: hypothetical protein [Actinomycetes]MCG7266663.1 hypothetical protein [Corynebacterium sp. ACRQJ]OCW59708.1 hypothetical protein AKG36_08955 [Trueperella bernardiae]OFT35976.1 hypothetical protein HMPREF3166_02100 [Corynebacterium sp. HMSC08A12]